MSIIDVSGLNPAMKDGAPAPSLLPMNGLYAIKMTKVQAKVDKNDKNYIAFMATVLDETEGEKGAVMYQNYLCLDGVNEIGKGANKTTRARVLDGLDYLTGAGKEGIVTSLIAGGKLDTAKLAAALEGLETFAFVGRQTQDDGREVSVPLKAVTSKAYNEAKTSGAGFRKAPEARVSKVANGVAASASTTVTDAQAAEV